MKKDYMEKMEPQMRTQTNANYCDVPIVVRSRSYQQPLEEAEAQTREALMQRTIRRGH